MENEMHVTKKITRNEAFDYFWKICKIHVKSLFSERTFSSNLSHKIMFLFEDVYERRGQTIFFSQTYHDTCR